MTATTPDGRHTSFFKEQIGVEINLVTNYRPLS